MSSEVVWVKDKDYLGFVRRGLNAKFEEPIEYKQTEKPKPKPKPKKVAKQKAKKEEGES